MGQFQIGSEYGKGGIWEFLDDSPSEFLEVSPDMSGFQEVRVCDFRSELMDVHAF